MKTMIVLALLPVVALAKEPRTIPTHETPIYLELNAKPIEVSAAWLHRYQCKQGRLLAAAEGSSARTPTRRVVLRCVN